MTQTKFLAPNGRFSCKQVLNMAAHYPGGAGAQCDFKDFLTVQRVGA